MAHVHRFRRITWGGRIALTRWRCSCGLKVSAAVARELEGRETR